MAVRLKHLAVGVVAALAAAVPFCAVADEDGDHDRARELYERGEIRGLGDVLRGVAASVPGDVVSVNLIQIGDAWVYRLQIVAADGRRTVLDVDAGTASAHPLSSSP